jgi:hypothetical protein
MPRKKVTKSPADMTTDEALDHLFPKPLAEALRDAVADDETEENPTESDDSN